MLMPVSHGKEMHVAIFVLAAYAAKATVCIGTIALYQLAAVGYQITLATVSYTHLSLITSVYQIFQYSATRLMYIIRSPYFNYCLLYTSLAFCLTEVQ